MPNYKKISSIRLNELELSLKGKSSNGKKYALQVSNLQKENIKELLPENKWDKIKINDHAYLIFGVAKQKTLFYELGELVCYLCFDDGRRMPLKFRDLNYKDHVKISKIIFERFAPDGWKKRVRHAKK